MGNKTEHGIVEKILKKGKLAGGDRKQNAQEGKIFKWASLRERNKTKHAIGITPLPHCRFLVKNLQLTANGTLFPLPPLR